VVHSPRGMDPDRTPMKLALVLLAIVACSSSSDTPPRKTSWAHTEFERRVAIGHTSALSAELQRAFDPIDHTPMQQPEFLDWLEVHVEPGQTFDEHRVGRFPAPDNQRRVIYIQPVGEMGTEIPPLEKLASVVQAFYGLEVRVLPVVAQGDVPAKRRGRDRWGHPAQIFAPDVFQWLVPRLADDAQAVVAVTMLDVYPRDDVWFLFGQASLTERVAVVSFARFDPAFYGEGRQAVWRERLFARTAFILIHEIGHTFGLSHCTFYECPFAGVNSHREIDRRPLHACPVCLRKLHAALAFDPAVREDQLADMFESLGFTDEAAWSKRRATWIRTGAR
jgi:archaemetzincin